MMTFEMWLTLGILCAAIVLFITEWLRVDIVALMVVVGLMLSGLLTPSEAVAGFANPVVLTIAALFIIGGGILQTGLAASIGRQMLRIAGIKTNQLIAIVMIAAALLSAFLSDTGTVAVLLPAVISLASSAHISPAKLLIPLAFGSLLGGAATLIGTPPNLIIRDVLAENGLSTFRFFDFTPIGIMLITGGVIFMLTIGKRLLPDRVPSQGIQKVSTPEEIAKRYQLPDNLFRLRIRHTSPLCGKTVAEGEFGARFNINILEIRRSDHGSPSNLMIGPNRKSNEVKGPSRKPSVNIRFQANDILLVQGTPTDVAHLAAYWNLGVQPADAEDDHVLVNREVGLAEVIIPPASHLIGKSILELGFGSRYHLSVLGLQRPGTSAELNIKTTRLHFGDVLLVQGPWENILRLRKQHRDFVIVGQPETMFGSVSRSKGFIAGIILLLMLISMIGEALPLTTTSMLAALLMIMTGCLTIDEAYGFIDWKSIVLIAGMLPMSTALQKVGLIDLAAESLTSNIGAFGPIWVLVGLFLITAFFTQVLSNTATAVLIAPLALSAAQNLDVSPLAFLMAVALAASMAFASPVASPVNTLVMGAGGYRFRDYIKIGLPLLFIGLLICILALPILWPF